MAIDPLRLLQIRNGRTGIALGLYIDIDDDDWEDFVLALPSVVAFDSRSGRLLLESIRDALQTSTAQEVSDEAAEALTLLLASDLHDQELAADFFHQLDEERCSADTDKRQVIGTGDLGFEPVVG